jgi:hypothetical protein
VVSVGNESGLAELSLLSVGHESGFACVYAWGLAKLIGLFCEA